MTREGWEIVSGEMCEEESRDPLVTRGETDVKRIRPLK